MKRVDENWESPLVGERARLRYSENKDYMTERAST